MADSPLKAIKQFCYLCQGETYAGVRQCISEKTCPLWPYRNGHDSRRSNNMTQEQKEASRQRMIAYHANRNNKEF